MRPAQECHDGALKRCQLAGHGDAQTMGHLQIKIRAANLMVLLARFTEEAHLLGMHQDLCDLSYPWLIKLPQIKG
jgi:hypothetical protein